jgi:hypothetical protein
MIRRFSFLIPPTLFDRVAVGVEADQTARMSQQLVLDDVPAELLVRLDEYAKRLGVSAAEAASQILSETLANAPAVPSNDTVSPSLVRRGGLLLHSGTLTPGASWPDASEEREEPILG